MLDKIMNIITGINASFFSLLIGIGVIGLGLFVLEKFIGKFARWVVGIGILLTLNGIISISFWKVAGMSVFNWIQTNVLNGIHFFRG